MTDYDIAVEELIEESWFPKYQGTDLAECFAWAISHFVDDTNWRVVQIWHNNWAAKQLVH